MGGESPSMQPSPSLSSESEHGFRAGSPLWSAGSSPSVIQFVSNVVVGGDGDMLAASLSACPSTRSSCWSSSSDIEIEVLFQGEDYDDDCTLPAIHSRSASLSGCSDGELDLESGRSRLLRTSSLATTTTEFVERDRTGELRWSALELEGLRLSSTSQRSAAGQIVFTSLVL